MDKVNKRKPIKFWLFALRCRQWLSIAIVLFALLTVDCNGKDNNDGNVQNTKSRINSSTRNKYDKESQRQLFNLTLDDNDGLPDETIKSANQTAAVAFSYKSTATTKQHHQQHGKRIPEKDRSTINSPVNDRNRELNRKVQKMQQQPAHSRHNLALNRVKTSDVKPHFAYKNKIHTDTTRLYGAEARSRGNVATKIGVTTSKPKKIHNLFTKPLLNSGNRNDGNYLSNALANGHVPTPSGSRNLALQNRTHDVNKMHSNLRPTIKIDYESKQHVFYKKSNFYPPNQRYNCVECQIIPGEPIRPKIYPTRFRYHGMFSFVAYNVR